MTIAGYAHRLRPRLPLHPGRVPRALQRLENAIAVAQSQGLLGDDILGQGFSFDIEIRRGAGAYICGEETAIFNSIEGFRGEPRTKPPFPVEKGLFGKPTVVNNVETLVNVPHILEMGAAAYAAVGTSSSTGTKLFCVSGTVERPGIYELPFGATLRDLLELAGGATGELRAVLLGGAAGAFVRADELDIPLTFEGTRAAGARSARGRAGAQRHGRAAGRAAAHRRVLPRRVVRPVRALPGRHGPPGGGPPPALQAARPERGRRRPAAAARGRPAPCATPRSAVWARTAWNAVESAIDRLGVFTAKENP